MTPRPDGIEHLLRGDLRAARDGLARAAQDDRDGVACHDLALALRAAGDLPAATLHAERALELATRAPTLALLASLRHLAGQRDAALALLRRALEVEPSHAPSRYALGLATGDAALLRSALPGLRGLIAERARGQLAELEAGGRPRADLCSAPLVSEVIGVRASAASPSASPSTSTSTSTSTTQRPCTPNSPSASRTPSASAPSASGIAPSASTRRGRTVDVVEVGRLLASSTRAVALTGAGLSVASGLRTRKALWREFDRDRAVSTWRFREEPAALWEVVRAFLGEVDGHIPNAAHRALASPRLAGVVTQNVDGLHQAAGSREVVELHGSLEATRCDACGARGPACRALLAGPLPPPCACGAALRPDVVLFGEWVAPGRLAAAAELVASCDLLLVVGTAADVSPAADLPRLAASRGAVVVEVKRAPSRLHHALGTLHLPVAAEDALPRAFEEAERG